MAEFWGKLSVPDKSPIPDSWGISRMNIVMIKYMWKIENYSYWDRKGEDYIGSPYFFIDKIQDTKWQMRLYPKRINIGSSRTINDSSKIVSLRLLLISSNESSVKGKCKFSILDNRGAILGKSSETDFHTFKKNFSSSLVTDLKFDEVGGLCNDDFTVMCEINMCKGSVYIPGPCGSSSDDPKVSQKNHHSDFENLLTTGRLSDVMLVLRDGVSIPAHKSILAARSSIFADMFEAQMRDSRTSDVSVVEIEECVMRELLRYVYADRVENIDDIAIRLLVAADRYKIEGLKNLCVDALAEKIDAENAGDILEMAKLYNLDGLKRKAVNVLAMTNGNPLLWMDAAEVVCSESPEVRNEGPVDRVKRIVKTKIFDKILQNL